MNLLQAVVFSVITFLSGYGVAYLVMTIGVKQDNE